VAGRRPLKPDTRVRVPPPLPSSSFTFRSSTRAVQTAVNRPMQVRFLPPEPFTRSRQHAWACSRPQPGGAEFDSRTTLQNRGPVVQRPGHRTLNPETRVRFPPGSPGCRVRPAAQDAGPSSRKRGFESRTRRSITACSSGREERRFGGPEAAGSSPATLTSSSGCSSAWLQSTRSGTVRARVRISPPRLHLPAGRPMVGHALDRRGISVRVRAGGPGVRVAQRSRAPGRDPGRAGSTPVPHPRSTERRARGVLAGCLPADDGFDSRTLRHLAAVADVVKASG
jgi:hypothetical protein